MIIDAPPEVVWHVASNLQAEMPRLVRDFRSVTVTPGTAEDLVMHACEYLGQRARFDVRIRPGRCWMQSRFLLCGMAAAPDPCGTGSVASAASGHQARHCSTRYCTSSGPAAVRLDRLQTDVQRHLDQQ